MVILQDGFTIGPALFPTLQDAPRIAMAPARALGNLPDKPGTQRPDEVPLLRKCARPSDCTLQWQ